MKVSSRQLIKLPPFLQEHFYLGFYLFYKSMLGFRFDFSKCIHMCGHLLTRRRIMQHNSPLLPAFVCLSHNLLSPYRLCKVPATEIMLLHTTYWKNNWVNYTIFINFYMPKYFKMKQIYALFFCKNKIKSYVLVDWMKASATRRSKTKPTKKTSGEKSP